MLYTLAVILLILWLLGFVAFHVGGGLIHLLLVIAVVVIALLAGVIVPEQIVDRVASRRQSGDRLA